MAFLCLYVTTGHFLLDVTDWEITFENMEGILQGRLYLDTEMMPDFGGMSYGVDGRVYSPFGIAQPILAMPFYLAGLAAAKVVPQLPERIVTRTAVMFFNLVTGALTCSVMFLILRSMGLSSPSSYAGVLLYGTATPAWPYARTFYANPLAALLLLLTVWYLYRARWGGNVRAALWAGVFAGLGLLVRHQFTFVAALGGLVLLVPLERSRSGWTAAARLVAWYAPVALLAMALWGWHNEVRYGSWARMAGSDWQRIGDTPLWRGLAILLVSPGKGLLWYAPVTLLAPLGFCLLWRKHRGLAVCALLMIGVLVTFYSVITAPGGHWCWGPRFLVDILALLGVACAFAFERWGAWTRRARAAAGLLVGVSIAVQILGCSVNVMHTYRRISDAGAPARSYEFQWRYSPLVNAAVSLGTEMRWTPLDLSILRSGSPPKDFRRDLRLTLDYWPALAWRVGLPWPLLLLFPIQLLLTWLVFRQAGRATRRAPDQVAQEEAEQSV